MNRVQHVYITLQHCKSTFMANFRSFSLKDIADSCGIPLPDYLVSCYYCNRWLTPHEKILYHHSDLLAVWQDDLPYACCQPCIRTAARVEFLTGFGRSLPCNRFGELSSQEWSEVVVRCIACLRKLTHVEKDDLLRNNLTIFSIRNGFRALCCLCRLGI